MHDSEEGYFFVLNEFLTPINPCAFETFIHLGAKNKRLLWSFLCIFFMMERYVLYSFKQGSVLI